MLKFAHYVADNRPLLLCGDFNAEPNEPVYSSVINCDLLKLSSGYADMMGDGNNCLPNDKETDENSAESSAEPPSRVLELANKEPPFTTWKIREDGEVCHTIDYVFYSQDKLKV